MNSNVVEDYAANAFAETTYAIAYYAESLYELVYTRPAVPPLAPYRHEAATVYIDVIRERQSAWEYVILHRRFPTSVSDAVDGWTHQLLLLDHWLATFEAQLPAATFQRWRANAFADNVTFYLTYLDTLPADRTDPDLSVPDDLYVLLDKRTLLATLTDHALAASDEIPWAATIAECDAALRRSMPASWVDWLPSMSDPTDVYRRGLLPERWWWYREGYQ